MPNSNQGKARNQKPKPRNQSNSMERMDSDNYKSKSRIETGWSSIVKAKTG